MLYPFNNYVIDCVTFTIKINEHFPLISLDLDVCKMCLEKQNGIFHPNNINHIKILDLAFESAIKMELWKEGLKYGILLIDGYRYIVFFNISIL